MVNQNTEFGLKTERQNDPSQKKEKNQRNKEKQKRASYKNKKVPHVQVLSVFS